MTEEARKLAERADHAVKALRGTDYKTLTPSYKIAQSLAEIIERLLAALRSPQPGTLTKELADDIKQLRKFTYDGSGSNEARHAINRLEAALTPSHEAGTQEPVAWTRSDQSADNVDRDICTAAMKTHCERIGIDTSKYNEPLYAAPASQDATREALEPFAEVAKYISPQCPDDYSLMQLHNLTAGHFRKAAAALASPARADRAVTADEGAKAAFPNKSCQSNGEGA